MVTRIKINMELELGIGKVHRDLVAHGLFESVEGGQLGVTPSPGVGGLEKLGEGRGDVRVVLDEALVKPTDAEEGADVLGAFGDGPIGDGVVFRRGCAKAGNSFPRDGCARLTRGVELVLRGITARPVRL